MKPVQKFALNRIRSSGFWQFIRTDPAMGFKQSEPESGLIYTDKNRRPFKTIAYNTIHKWLALSSLGTIMIIPFDPDNTGNLNSGMFITRHKGVISHMDFSPDNAGSYLPVLMQ